ncbi:alcohol dehydrogenase [Corallococcus coralloides]|uniref:alcohol dehydrogenase n=1 Tax=Corallococcus coralloides TaxID=184914 RepID=A0A410RN86_CORCK|nr:NAD(P)-dependent alcohol dehydrogenase [Corallococcus coralloides]QAT83293.1 alcohol dehydrogenase [Corallococcus coralloides]
MKAYSLMQWRQPAAFREVEVPEPGPGEVLIKVGGAGLCHSDLHLMDWEAGTLDYRLPFTLGHENAGWVEKTGAGVTGLRAGDPVLVAGHWGCGRCHRCRQGMENYCERQGQMPYAGGGLGRDGGLAPYLLVPSSRLLVPLEGLDPRQAAPLADAALTSYHAIKRSLPLLGAGSTAVVIGVGGLGQMGVQVLHALTGARVVAVDTSPRKLEIARRDGADEAVLADAAVERVRELTHGKGADLVVDMVGTDGTLQLAAGMARTLGHLTLVGLGGGTLPVGFFRVPYECSVATTYWGSIPELMEVVALAEAGRIRTEVELVPLEQVEDAYRRLRAGAIAGRAVATPNG